MATVRRKDRSGLVGRRLIRAEGDRYCLGAYLWATKGDLLRNTTGTDISTAACFCPMPYRVRFGADLPDEYISPRLIGEVHFIRGRWDSEQVFHELTHAALHRLRSQGVFLAHLDMEQEEPHCYAIGRWGDQIHGWLWELDPRGSE